MKVFKHMTALVLALIMVAALAVTAYAATVTVKYREFVYSGQITFRQYDYSQSTSPTVINMTISATSSLGSGSALYHVKYANGTVAYCIQPGVHSDDSGSYVQGSSGCWYNLPASVQSAIALALACGYPSADYGTASGDRNSSAIINAEKWAATQAIIWELICEYRSAYTYDDWGYSPFYDCVDTSRYPTFELWYDEIAAAMQSANEIPSFATYAELWADVIELKRNAAGSYTASVTDTNGVLSAYNFTANSGNGVTFTRKGNTLTITATAAAAKNLLGEKTYAATGSAFEMDPDEAVLCWYDRTGRYQAMASYTGVGRDPLRVYIKIRAVEEKGSLTINKVDAETGKALAGVTYRLYDSSGEKCDGCYYRRRRQGGVQGFGAGQVQLSGDQRAQRLCSGQHRVSDHHYGHSTEHYAQADKCVGKRQHHRPQVGCHRRTSCRCGAAAGDIRRRRDVGGGRQNYH